MKKRQLISTFLFGFLFLMVKGYGQNTKPSTYFHFAKGEQVYVFGDKVNVRDVPTTKGHILTTLSVGATVEVVEVLTNQQPIVLNGLEGPWVRIKYDDSEANGFIWAPLLTNVALLTPHYTYLFGLVSAQKGRFRGQLRAVKYHDIWEKVEFEVIGGLEHTVQSRISGNLGYKGIDHVIEIYFEPPGEQYHQGLGHVTFFNSQDGVYYVSRQLQYIRGNYDTEYNRLVYPKDKEGQADRILKRREVNKYDDIGNGKTTVTITVWEWNEELEKLVRTTER